MSWLQSIFYALISGLVEFLPISAQAHQTALQCLFGVDRAEPVYLLFVHLGTVLGLGFAMRDQLRRMSSELRLSKRSSRRKKNLPHTQERMELNLLRTACIPLMVGFLFYLPAWRWSSQLHICALFLLINGVLLYVPAFLPRPYKETQRMSPMDGILIGISSWLAVFTGVSRIGMTVTVATVRGANMHNAYKWSLLLSIPALLALMVLDLFLIFTGGMSAVSFGLIVKSIVSACFAFGGAFICVSMIRSFVQRNEFSGFSFYCWGAALFCFILFLI